MSAAFNGAARLEARRRRHAGGVPWRRAGLAQPVARQWRHYLPVASAVARRDAGAREPAVFAAGAPGAVFAVRAGAGLRAPHDRGLRQRHRPPGAAAAGEAPVQASFNPRPCSSACCGRASSGGSAGAAERERRRRRPASTHNGENHVRGNRTKLAQRLVGPGRCRAERPAAGPGALRVRLDWTPWACTAPSIWRSRRAGTARPAWTCRWRTATVR